MAKRDRRICSLHWRRCTNGCHRRFFLLPAPRIPQPAGTIRVLVRPICCGRLQGRFARLVCAYRHKAPFTLKEFCSVCCICVRYNSINTSSSAATSSRPFITLKGLPELNADGTIFAGSELVFLAAMDSRRLESVRRLGCRIIARPGLPLMDDLVRANTECGVQLRPLGTKPLGPESH